MLMNHKNHPQSVRTAYFVMPDGKLFSTDAFNGEDCELIIGSNKKPIKSNAEIMTQLRNGYAERVREINEGKIETAGNVPVNEIDYTNSGDVYPLEADKNNKVENLYSDYNCFTI